MGLFSPFFDRDLFLVFWFLYSPFFPSALLLSDMMKRVALSLFIPFNYTSPFLTIAFKEGNYAIAHTLASAAYEFGKPVE